jgi:hypothetical protein
MGISTNSDICRNIVRLFAKDIGRDKDADELGNLPHGWILVGEAVLAGKKDRLYASQYAKVKDGVLYLVNELNESPYAAGGEYHATIFSPNKNDWPELVEMQSIGECDYEIEPLDGVTFGKARDSILLFMSDFGLTEKIYDVDTVQQTL